MPDSRTSALAGPVALLIPLAGDGIPVRCADGTERPPLSLDAARLDRGPGAGAGPGERISPW
jgi:hypothetical protein